MWIKIALTSTKICVIIANNDKGLFGMSTPVTSTAVAPLHVGDELDTQAKVLNYLMAKVPNNEYSMPVGIYRPDLLPIGMDENGQPEVDYTTYNEDSMAAAACAWIPLDFGQGYPTMPNGLPLWSQFEFEPIAAFRAFECFRAMEEEHYARDVNNFNNEVFDSLSDVDASMRSPIGRQLDKVPAILGKLHNIQLTLPIIAEYSQLFMWNLRVKAYDMFKLAAHKREQSLRQFDTLDTHYLAAQKLFRRLLVYLDNEEDFWDLMTPKAAVDLLKATTQLQRISAGLPAAGPPTANHDNENGASLELLLKTAAEKHVTAPAVIEEDNSGRTLETIQTDEQLLQTAQELAIKIQTKN